MKKHIFNCSVGKYAWVKCACRHCKTLIRIDRKFNHDQYYCGSNCYYSS